MLVVVVTLWILNKYDILYYNSPSHVPTVREALVQCYNSDKEETINWKKMLDFNGLIISSSLDYLRLSYLRKWKFYPLA